MKKQHFVWLFVSLFLLAVPAVQTFASGNEVEITLLKVSGSLPAGLYFLRLIVNGKVETVEKIIKIQ